MQYISFYDHISNKKDERLYDLAGSGVTAYVAEALSRAGIDFNLISMAFSAGRKLWYPGKKFVTPEGFRVILPPSLGNRWRIMRYFRALWHRIMKYAFPLLHVSYGETVLVYHSVWICPALHVLKKLKHIKLILQVEEIYADVNMDEKMRRIEEKAFGLADAFIFPTATLEKIVNTEHKPYILLHGCYKPEKRVEEPFPDGKIHCVYAGTFSSVKGGAYTAVDAAKYLDDQYVIHILGKAGKEELGLLNEHIRAADHENGCKVIYEGFRQGEELSGFLQACRVGLSTQNPEGIYNMTSFPSKVLMYMTQGLKVVSVDLPVLRESKISQFIEYADSAKAEDIANAIRKASLSPSDGADNMLKRLDEEFMLELKALVQSVNSADHRQEMI